MSRFGNYVKRDGNQLRDDRAKMIEEDAKTIFKRAIEDQETRLKRLKVERENLLDFGSPESQGIISASEFDSRKYVQKEINILTDIHFLEKVIDLSKERYATLFDGEVSE